MSQTVISPELGSPPSPVLLDFTQAVVNIGSHPDNDITIPGQGVLPFHALVVIQEDKRELVSLSPNAAILVDGVPMDETSITLARNQQVEIGGYTLRFQGNGAPGGVNVSIMSRDITTAPLGNAVNSQNASSWLLPNAAAASL